MPSKRGKLEAKKSKLEEKKERFEAKMKGTETVKKSIQAGVALVAAMVALTGCQSTPSRSQTQTISDCTFYVFVPHGDNPTNVTAESDGSTGTIGDLFAQNMMIENSGSESLAPQHTISPTTDLSYGVGTGGGSTWGELFSGMKSLFTGGTATGTATGTSATATATPSAASVYAAGNCDGGTCTTPK
jgi:hypothetical protein